VNDHVSEEQATINPSEASHYDLMIEENADGDGFKVGKYDSGSDSQEMNPKKRARLGQEKTKWDRMSLGQKAKRISTDQLCKLSEVLMVLTMALGSWTQEVVWQTCTPSSPPNMTISHPGIQKILGSTQWIAWRFSLGIARYQVPSQTNVAVFHNLVSFYLAIYDVLLTDVFRDIYEHRPRMIWMAPPCTNWRAFSSLNIDPQERRRRRNKEKKLIELN